MTESTRQKFGGGDPDWIRTSDPQLRRLMIKRVTSNEAQPFLFSVLLAFENE